MKINVSLFLALLLVALVASSFLSRAQQASKPAQTPNSAPVFPTASDLAPAPKIVKPDPEWKTQLSPAQYAVLRRKGTERAGSSELLHEHRHGVFVCAACGAPLFGSDAKFESGTGWPSFTKPFFPQAVLTVKDRSFFIEREEVQCARCGGHLGHIFDDGPAPTGLRYCMNGVALKFQERP